MISATGVAASAQDKTYNNVLLVDQKGYEQASQSDRAVKVRVGSDRVLGDISEALKGFADKHGGKTSLFLLLPLAGCGGGSSGGSANVIGRAVDGYIVGGTVERVDGSHTAVITTAADDATTADNEAGSFDLTALGGSGPFKITGGIDIGANNAAFTGSLIAPEAYTVATPLSTLIQGLIEDGQDLAAAETSIKTALGLTGISDLSDYDPVALIEAGGADAALALTAYKAGVQVATLLKEASGNDADGFFLVARALADTLNTQGTAFSLTDADDLDTFLNTSVDAYFAANLTADELGSFVVDKTVASAVASTNTAYAEAADLSAIATLASAAGAESGVALKGPLHKATVFADYNADGELSAGEAFTTTGSDGSYELDPSVVYKDADRDGNHDDTGEAIDTSGFDYADYSIVVQMNADTIDYSTGESYANAGVSLKAAPGGDVITPMTTLHEHSEEHATDFEVAELAAALGVPDGVDILTFNTHAKGVDEALAHEVESIQQHLMTTTMLVQAAISGSSTVPTDALSFVKTGPDATINFAGAALWSGVTITGETDAISDGNETVSVSIWSPAAGEPVLLKLSSGADTPAVELEVNTTVSGGWEVLTYNFANVAGLDHANSYNVIDVFPSFMEASSGQQYYLGGVTSADVQYDYSNILQVSKSADAAVKSWAGVVLGVKDSGEFISEGNETVTMRVYSPAAGDRMTLKLEQIGATSTNYIEADATTTVTGGWETLTFDLSAADHSFTFNQALLFPDNGTASSGKDWYVGDVTFGSDVVNFATDNTLARSTAFEGAYAAVVPGYSIDGVASARASAHSDAAGTAGTVGIFDYSKLLLNPPPAFTSDATVSLSEDATTGTLLTLAATDTETVTYSISSGADIDGDGTDDVTVDSSTGVVSYTLSGDGFDYETATSHSLTFSASDGTTATSQVFTLNVTNVDEAPTLAVVLGTGSTAGTAQTLAEDAAAANTTVFTATATDPESATPTYTLTGTDKADFSISSSGAVTLNTAGDYETKTSYALTINASDGTNTVSQAVTLALTNVNEAPDISVTVDGSTATAATVAEGTATSTTIFTVDDGDPDAGDSITYSLGAHSDTTDDSASFSIDQTTGVITFAASPDYETKTSYKLAVTASDGTLSDSQDLTVAVTDVAGDSPLEFEVLQATTSGTTIAVKVNPDYASGVAEAIAGYQFDFGVTEVGGVATSLTTAFDELGPSVDFAWTQTSTGVSGVSGSASDIELTIDDFVVNDTEFVTDEGYYSKVGPEKSLKEAASNGGVEEGSVTWGATLNDDGKTLLGLGDSDHDGIPATGLDYVLGTLRLGAAEAGSYTVVVTDVLIDFAGTASNFDDDVTFTIDVV